MKQLLRHYGLIIVLTLITANLGVAMVTNLRSKAQTCFTTAQVTADARCLYIYSNKVYTKGSKASPHKNHPCGMDVTSILPSFHFTFAGFTNAYIGNICAAAVPTPSLPPIATATGGPTPNPSCPKKNQGDADCDGFIKLADYDTLRKEFYGELTTKTADFNGDGRVSLADHSLWRQTYFDINGGTLPTPTPTSSTNPPSPTPPSSLSPTPTTPTGPTPTNPPPGATSGIWISTAEIMNLPTSGAAWSNLQSAANSSWGTANLADNNSDHDVLTLAGALVSVRTGDAAMKQKTIAGLQSATHSGLARALELSRGLQSYIIAADIIGYHDPSFEAWVRQMLAADVSGHSGGSGIVGTAELSANNWGGHARASVTAAALYLKDTALLQRMVTAQKAFIGMPAPGNKLVYTATNWHAGSPQAGENVKGATVNGQDVSGVLAEDWRRAAEFKWPPSLSGYMWEGMQGYVVTAVLMHRAGVLPFSSGDNAVVRAMDILYKINNGPSGDDTWIPWVVNHYGGTHYATNTASTGKNMGWTDWTHAK